MTERNESQSIEQIEYAKPEYASIDPVFREWWGEFGVELDTLLAWVSETKPPRTSDNKGPSPFTYGIMHLSADDMKEAVKKGNNERAVKAARTAIRLLTVFISDLEGDL